jgi:hypothetical protein
MFMYNGVKEEYFLKLFLNSHLYHMSEDNIEKDNGLQEYGRESIFFHLQEINLFL